MARKPLSTAPPVIHNPPPTNPSTAQKGLDWISGGAPKDSVEIWSLRVRVAVNHLGLQRKAYLGGAEHQSAGSVRGRADLVDDGVRLPAVHQDLVVLEEHQLRGGSVDGEAGAQAGQQRRRPVRRARLDHEV